MKIKTTHLIILLLLLTGLTSVYGQDNFTGKLYAKIFFEEIEIQDANYEIVHSDQIFDFFYRKDTIGNCFGGLSEEFIDNIYQNPTTSIILTTNEFDSTMHIKHPNLFALQRVNRTDNGEYMNKKTSFFVSKDIIKSIDQVENKFPNDGRLVTSENEKWKLKSLTIDRLPVFLDSCHLKYQLSFDTLSTYHQNYQSAKLECSTSINKEQRKAENQVNYWSEDINHQITFDSGLWRTKGSQLILINKQKDALMIFEYVLDKQILKLKYNDRHQMELEKIK